jgi:diguanylate cyclase (GGDEF)-like protein/PAS domain S-box-containing protein
MPQPLILIVDNYLPNATLLTKIFDADYRIKTANNGLSALAIANTSPQPDLILLDVSMPAINGFEVCRQLKQNPKTRGIPVIFVTAQDDESDEAYGLGLGAVDYITKPFSIAITKARVDNHIRLRQETRHRTAAFEELQVAGLVYNHVREGMMLTDADNIIVGVNPAFTRLTGYSSAEVLGKNPRILSSGRQNPQFYQAMWHSLKTTGSWSGEIWNRRKNGSEYVELLSINTIYRDDGSVRVYVALFTDITLKKQADEMIWRQTNFDQLTGLINRHMFRERLSQALRKAHRSQQPMALMFLDLDHFKEVNDSFGHEVGDKLLQETARRLQGCIRESDTVARLGGDEFTIILEELDNLDDVERVAQCILHSLAEPFSLADESIYVSASIGLTFYPNDASDIDTLIKNADQAMYAAKNQGRNGYRYFTAGMQETAQNRMRLISDLRVALLRKQFEVYYQPIVELTSGNIHKIEALVRWRHPVRGLVSPADFIPLAEETGLIHEIGNWVFHEATQQLAHWRERYNIPLQISINKSPAQFAGNHVNHNDWFDYLQRLGLPEHSVVVEITESLLLDADSAITDRLLAFRDAGLQVAIDDFGTGYSALSYLKKFDIDYLKIDQSFTQGLAPDSEDLALCEAMVMMAHKLGLKVIAEGVETQAQSDLLTHIGCDYGQGYLYARPMPSEDFGKLLTLDMRNQLSATGLGSPYTIN